MLVVVVDVSANGFQLGVNQPGQPVDQGFGGEQSGGHIRQLFADGAEGADGLAELLTLAGVAGRFGQDVLAAAGDRRAELETTDIEHVEGNLVPLADFTEQVLHRDLGVVENHRGGG